MPGAIKNAGLLDGMTIALAPKGLTLPIKSNIVSGSLSREMEILRNITIAIIILAVLYLGRRAISRFVKDVFSCVYWKAVAIVGGIVLCIIVGLLFALFQK
jgi:hypothetical protein